MMICFQIRALMVTSNAPTMDHVRCMKHGAMELPTVKMVKMRLITASKVLMLEIMMTSLLTMILVILGTIDSNNDSNGNSHSDR